MISNYYCCLVTIGIAQRVEEDERPVLGMSHPACNCRFYIDAVLELLGGALFEIACWGGGLCFLSIS